MFGLKTHGLLAAASLLISTSVLASFPTRPVALSGELNPGHTSFGTFRFTTQIAINNAGQILFEGHDESDGNLWLAQPDGSFSVLHHFGDPAPGLPGLYLGMADRFYIHWYLNELGQTTVTSAAGSLISPDAGENVAWIGTAGSMSIAARQSAPPAGLVGTVTDVRALHLNDRGDVVVWYETNHLTGTGILAAGAPNDLKILAQDFSPVQPIMLDNLGNVAFLIAQPNEFKIFQGAPSNPKLIAQSDSNLGNPFLSKNGHIAFSGSIAHGPRSLYVGAPGSDAVAVLHDGDPAPGLPGQTIDAPVNPSITDDGYIAFEASAGGRYGYWAGRPGNFKPVALEGDSAPADIPGLVFNGLSNDLAFINNSGELLFEGSYRSPATLETGAGLWVTDNSGDLHLIARDHGQLEFDGQTRTISQLGLRYGLNDSGEVAFSAQFTDGSSGVFLATVPEPASVFVLMPILLLMRRGRRQSMGT